MNENKKKEIQKKYREKMKEKNQWKEKDIGKFTLEAIIVTAIIVIIIFLNYVIKGF